MNQRVAAYGYRGGSLFGARDFSMAGALVKHPKGDLPIDTGFGRNIARGISDDAVLVPPCHVLPPVVETKVAGAGRGTLFQRSQGHRENTTNTAKAQC